MTDRVLRDELFESDRWLDLPSDTDRLAFISLLPIADDFGNLEGGTRRLFRYFAKFTQIKSEEGAAAVLLHLTDADLIRAYTVDSREFYHVPRFRSPRWYYARKVPGSQWDDTQHKLGKTQRAVNQALAEKVDTTSQQRDDNTTPTLLQRNTHVAEGVGVGEGEKLTRRKRKSDLPADFSVSKRVATWAAQHGHNRLDERLASFVSYVKRNGKQYVDWDEAFMEAVRMNWAGLEMPTPRRRVPAL